MIRRLIFWLNWSSWLGCRHCCLKCELFKGCKKEVEDYLDALDFHTPLER